MKALVDTYSVEELQEMVNKSHSYKELLFLLGYASSNGNTYKTVKNRIELYNIGTSHFQEHINTIRTEENVFVKNSTATQAVLRRWYYKGEYTPYKCAICGIEEWQGKPLVFTLDHIDGDSHNNELSNLRWICPNCDRQLPTYSMGKARLDAKLQTEQEKHFCIDCGKEIGKYGERCGSCAAKNSVLRKIAKENLPSREELKNLIRNNSFLEIGRMFSVSDNAIRNWCKNYNLPHKKTEIKNYTDEEWLNI